MRSLPRLPKELETSRVLSEDVKLAPGGLERFHRGIEARSRGRKLWLGAVATTLACAAVLLWWIQVRPFQTAERPSPAPKGHASLGPTREISPSMRIATRDDKVVFMLVGSVHSDQPRRRTDVRELLHQPSALLPIAEYGGGPPSSQ